jgi:hypothetical protein
MFIQLIDCRTSKIDEVTALDEEWKKATEGQRTVRRSIITRDRNDPDRHVIIVFFDDYESAMVNSNLPATGEFARKQMELLDGPMSFVDLDVLVDETD